MTKNISNTTCYKTMKLLGDYWTLRIIDALSQCDEVRFCELQRQLENLNPATLTKRLKKLEDTNLITRHEDLVDKISVSYSLSALGVETTPIINAVNKFSEKTIDSPY